MAKVKFSAIVNDLRGTVGTMVFSVAKRGINYIRSQAINPFNPVSIQQARARTRLQSSVNRWFNDLNPGQRQTWKVMSDRLADIAPVTGDGGIRDMVPNVGGLMSGVNAYAGFRSRSIAAGLGGSFSDIAPVGEQQPTPPENVAGSYDTGTNILTVTWADPSTIDAAGVIAVWLRSRERVFHKQFRTVVALGVGTVNMSTAKSTAGDDVNFGDVEEANLIIQLQSINPSGFASEGSAAIEVELPTV